MMRSFLLSFLLFLLGIPVTIIGLPVVALALPFRKEVNKLVRLPSWALWWDNPVDGMLGDSRGWWNQYCLEHYDKPATAFYSMWQWAAIRNPANYWSRVVTGVDASRCKVEQIASGKYWRLLKGTRDDGKFFPLFEGEIPYNSTHGFYCRFGWKIELNDTVTDTDKYRGSVFKFSPWKGL